jgi:dGTP triphosphohydrolase
MDRDPGDQRRASLRASDADRERFVETLRQHHADGRLTTEELAERTERATRLLTDLYGHYLEHPDTMPMGASLASDPVEQQAVDAIAGMTDRYALAAWKAAFAPEAV